MDKIEIIYKMLIYKIKLNDFTLGLYGINQEEITELVKRKIIEPTKDGSYKLYQVDKLRKYGVSLLLKKQYEEADKCFEVCYELAPTGKHICLQAMLAAINKKDYQKAFQIYTNLEKIHSEKNTPNNTLYLYLLSVIAKVPEEYKERTKEINPSDIILPYTNGTKVENDIRIAISRNKFAYACHLINDRMSKEKNYSVKFELLKALIYQAADWNSRFKDKIFHLIQNQDYEQIISLLLEQKKQRRLSELETNTLLLTDALVKMSKTRIIPTITIESTDNLQEAILGNNFELALNINDSYIKTNKMPDSVEILLMRINLLIFKIKSEEELEQAQKSLLEAEELAKFIANQNIPIDLAIKQSGLFPEQKLLIKLIYARNYYQLSDYENGDKYLQEVEQSNFKTESVILLLEEIKENRNKYSNQIPARQLTKNK